MKTAKEHVNDIVSNLDGVYLDADDKPVSAIARTYHVTEQNFTELNQQIWVGRWRPDQNERDGCGIITNQVAAVTLMKYLRTFNAESNQDPLDEMVDWAESVFNLLGESYSVECDKWFDPEFLNTERTFVCAIEVTE